VLMTGFLIPMFSKFRLPCYFGILAATTMVGALFGDLILTPAILRIAGLLSGSVQEGREKGNNYPRPQTNRRGNP